MEVKTNKVNLKANIAFNTIYQVLIILAPLITTPYISRVLGPANAGNFAYTQAIANYFFLFAMLGVNNYGNRVVSSSRNNRELLSQNFWNIYCIQFCLTLIAIPIYLVYVFFFSQKELISLALIQGIQIVSVFFDVNWLLFGLEKFKVSSIRNIIVKLLTIASIFVFVKDESDINIYALIIAIGTVLGLLVILPAVAKEISFIKPKWAEVKNHFKKDLVLFLPLLAAGIYQYIDKIMLGTMESNVVVGYYAYANNIINLPIALITGVCTVIMPRITYMRATADERVGKFVSSTMLYVFILSIAMAGGLFAIANRFVPIFLGDAFWDSTILLKLLCIALPIQCYSYSYRMVYLIPYEKDKLYVISIFVGAGVNIIGNIIMIKLWGAQGACYSTIIANFVAMLVQVIGTRKDFTHLSWVKKMIPYVFITIGMIVALFFINNAIENQYIALIVQVIVGAVMFTVCASIALYIQKDEYFCGTLKRHFHIKKEN